MFVKIEWFISGLKGEYQIKLQTRMDNRALNGLRGFLACHVFCYHTFVRIKYNSRPILLYGNLALPPFYLLSGFCLTLSYGTRLWRVPRPCYLGLKPTASDKSPDLEIADDVHELFDYWSFYKRRLLRIMPVHYLVCIYRIVIVRKLISGR